MEVATGMEAAAKEVQAAATADSASTVATKKDVPKVTVNC